MKPALPATLLKLAAVAVLFYASYGLTNYLTALRAPVPEIIYGWERAMPFVPWTIIPYWSLNLLYALGFFLARTRAELHRYIAQLLAAQAIAVCGFLLFPLQISWAKPDGDGIFFALFRSLAAFDQAYNEAPSLHIILTLIVGRYYWAKLPRVLRPLWLGWCLLIGGSVLTTWQHHFIDIPTALVAGALILWALPWQAASPLRGRTTPTPRKRLAAALYLLAALTCALPALRGGAWLWLLCGSVACLLAAAGYARYGAAIWQKQENGQPTLAARLLLWPLQLVAVINRASWLRHARDHDAITPRLALGSNRAAASFAAVVDTCAELPPRGRPAHYRCVPMLDMVAPEADELRRAAAAIEALLRVQSAPVLVCCALGYGRSVAALATWLVRYGDCADMDDALARIRQTRPLARLPDETRAAVAQAIAP